MRTSDICPTCSTYENALCIIYNGPLLTTLDIATLDSVETALTKIETWAAAVPSTSLYTADGALADTRTVTIPSGMTLTFQSESLDSQLIMPDSATMEIIAHYGLKLNLGALGIDVPAVVGQVLAATTTDGGVEFQTLLPIPASVAFKAGAVVFLDINDANNIVTISHTLNPSIEIPLNSSVAYPVGTKIEIVNVGVTSGTISTAVGVTLLVNPNVSTSVEANGGSRTITKVAADDTWAITY